MSEVQRYINILRFFSLFRCRRRAILRSRETHEGIFDFRKNDQSTHSANVVAVEVGSKNRFYAFYTSLT